MMNSLKCLANGMSQTQNLLLSRLIHTSPICLKKQAGRYKVTQKRNRQLTYEMANPPHYIAHRKSWNSWNCANLTDGLRPSETAIEDMFIRKFITGTFHKLVLSEVIIKRQFNHIRIAVIMHQRLPPRKFYFLIGYTEELLTSWLQCPITLEIQMTPEQSDVVFKYI